MSEMCLGHCQASVIELHSENVSSKKLLTIFTKKHCHRYCNWQGSQYSSTGIFPLSDCLGNHFEFRITPFNETYVYGYPQACVGSYLRLMMEFFLQNLSKFEQIGTKILFMFRKIQLRIWTLITSNTLNPLVPNAAFLYPLKTSGVRERVLWEQVESNINLELFL